MRNTQLIFLSTKIEDSISLRNTICLRIFSLWVRLSGACSPCRELQETLAASLHPVSAWLDDIDLLEG